MTKHTAKAGGIQRLARSRDTEKASLDLQTSYITLLPNMDEGFHIGYQSKPGIVSDTNTKPHEWLENVAKYMQTQGEDVGYSIPDILAGEQQMRRLCRLPYDESVRHQEMISWRGILALLLLWDSWPRDETWPVISPEAFFGEKTPPSDKPFQRTVYKALTGERLAEGLEVLTISLLSDQKPDKRPLCLISRSVIIVPAADPGDLGEILPRRVRWYDRDKRRFQDPCSYLEEVDRTRLIQRLRMLQTMNENKETASLIYSPQAHLFGLLDRFIDDLQTFRKQYRNKLEQREEQARQEFYIRSLAVYGLMESALGMDIQGLHKEHHQQNENLQKNVLLCRLMSPQSVWPDLSIDVCQYTLNGIPFARASANWLLEPANHTGEPAALKILAQELSLLNDFSSRWNEHMHRRFYEIYAETQARVGVSPAVLQLLWEWSAKHSAFPMQRDRNITLYYPIKGHPQTLALLLADLLGIRDTDRIQDAFSDSLLVITDAKAPPFNNTALCEACQIKSADTAEPFNTYAIPPLSSWLAAWLMDEAEKDEHFSAKLATESLSFLRDPVTGNIQASFRITCRKQGKDAVLINSVTFCRTYTTTPGMNGMITLTANQLPFVLAWPNVRLSTDVWKQYFIYAHNPGSVDIWVQRGGIWVQGALCRATDSNNGEQQHRLWQTATTERYPAYIILKRGALTLGALYNDAPREMLKHEPSAVISVDFGSIATTVMMRQGDKVQPAIFPKCMHTALLHVMPGDEGYLQDEFLPADVLLPNPESGTAGGRESTFYSVMDMFTDDRKKWRFVLQDGHIYYRASLADLMRKSETSLYYDMKWSDEEYVLQCMRLFLKQVMLQASLSARLNGAPSVSWRISMPNALPLTRQESYLEMMRGLSMEIAVETGVPITQGIPGVLYATENQADGLYFRGRNEVNVRNGYINMDIGGGTTDISVWLNNAQRATLGTSLLLGCRQMLFDSVSSRHLGQFERDFEKSGEQLRTVVRNVAQTLASSVSSTRGRQKSMFLLDDFFAGFDREIWAMIAQVRGEGRISYVESLLLLNIGFLFHMCGVLLNQVWLDPNCQQQLHQRMEICIAGNGGQLLKAFDNETRTQLCRLALQALEKGHPIRELMLVQSRHPKQEVAIGLLSEEQAMDSAIHRKEGWRSGLQVPTETTRHHQMMLSFPVRFYSAFPQAAERLLPSVFEVKKDGQGVELTAAATVEMSTILDNEFSTGAEDDLSIYARCFAAMKRLWRV